MRTLTLLLAVSLLLTAAFQAQAQTLAGFEATVAAPADGGGGPVLWYRNADSATESGHMDSTGSASNQAFRLGGQLYADYFGNADKAFGLAAATSASASISGSSSLFMTGAQGTVSFLFKTGADLTTLQSLFRQGGGFELIVFNGRVRLSYTSDGTKTLNIGPSLQGNTWYHVALKWDTTKPSDDLTWYLGVAGSGTMQSGTVSIDAAGGNTSIEIAGRSNSNFFLNPMQQFAVWQRELSAASIQAMYDATVPTGNGAMVEVTLEKSTDLQNWEPAEPGLYDISGEGLFFRAIITPK
jgi:hypothetical protein